LKSIRKNGAQICLNLHAQVVHSPAVLAAYTSLRAVIAEYGALKPKVSWAFNLATAVTVGNDYMIAILRCGRARRPRILH
jgi:hypothetical protein